MAIKCSSKAERDVLQFVELCNAGALQCAEANAKNNPGAKEFQARMRFVSSYDFVLKCGRFWTPAPLPRRVKKMQMGACFYNAFSTILYRNDIYYTEGYAACRAPIPVMHAWLTDSRGRVIDPTWGSDGVAYLGVQFQKAYVIQRGFKTKAPGSLIDAWEYHWPLLTGEHDLDLAIRGESHVEAEVGV